jgi:hypothetical protein
MTTAACSRSSLSSRPADRAVGTTEPRRRIGHERFPGRRVRAITNYSPANRCCAAVDDYLWTPAPRRPNPNNEKSGYCDAKSGGMESLIWALPAVTQVVRRSPSKPRQPPTLRNPTSSRTTLRGLRCRARIAVRFPEQVPGVIVGVVRHQRIGLGRVRFSMP